MVVVLVTITVAGTCHIVKTTNGVVVISKKYFSFNNTYVDLTQWDIPKFLANLELTIYLVEKKVISHEIMARLREYGIEENLRTLSNALEKQLKETVK